MPTKTTRPAKKRTAKKAARKGTTRKATKRPAARKLSAGHKKALAEGRTMSAVVDRYLQEVNKKKRRGRKLSTASIEARLAKAKAEAKQPGVKAVLAIQEMRNLEVQLAGMMNASNGSSLKSAEAAFVKVAKRFGENRGIGYSAWRDAGVPAPVLKKSGIARTRSA